MTIMLNINLDLDLEHGDWISRNRQSNKIEKASGLCYETALRHQIKGGGILHHGSIQGDDGKRVNHAWVEHDNMIFEPQTGHMFDKNNFNSRFKPESRNKYSQEEAGISMIRNKHMGPWEKQEGGGAGTVASGGFTPTFGGGGDRKKIREKIHQLMEKSKVYLENNEEPPEGKVVQTGSRGGRYYQTSPHFTDAVKRTLPRPEGPMFSPSGKRIPPAWTDLWVTTHKDSYLQARGLDSAGRKVFLYSSNHRAYKDAQKFQRLKLLINTMDHLKPLIESDAFKKEEALVIDLIIKTGFRVGTEQEHIAKVKAYGATTLQKQHVKVSGNSIHFDFIGKKGVRITKTLNDPFLASKIKERIEKNKSDQIFNTTSTDVRNYLHSLPNGKKFKLKDFRTLLGTKIALSRVKALPMPENVKEFKKYRKQVAESVSKELGNTPAVALKSYIAPEVFYLWEAKFSDMIKKSDDESMKEFANSIFYTDESPVEDDDLSELDDENDDYDEPYSDEDLDYLDDIEDEQ